MVARGFDPHQLEGDATSVRGDRGGSRRTDALVERPFITDGPMVSLSSISRTFGPTTSVANRLIKEASQSRKSYPTINLQLGRSCYVSQTRPEGVRKQHTGIYEHIRQGA